ncbi:MAG: cytochrome bc complex cytochrome b subunit [Planctomycetes bacterium]|nr:cytochrome bc complex cytochrome b subunit [Planctomycetota bacterium]
MHTTNHAGSEPGAAGTVKKGFFAERLPIRSEGLVEGLNEPIPGHLKRWWFALGGTPLYLFLVQVTTGILLTFYYVPSPDRAYDSVKRITEEVTFGWWIRSMHRWSSHLMIASVILHVMRVYFTGTYRKPREFTWMAGVAILGITLFFGFTGYSLVYEQLSYWGATVAGNLTAATPLIGKYLASLLRGGDNISDNTLTRFFVLHIGILPTALFLILCSHIFLVRLHGVAQVDSKRAADRKSFPFFPDHMLTECLVFLTITIVLNTLACAFPAGLAERADPLNPPMHIKPEWYFFFTFRWLKLTGLETAVVTTGMAGAVLFFWPFIDAAIRRKRPNSEISIFLGIIGFATLIALTIWEAIA